MAKLKVKFGKGELILSKNTHFVGIKMTSTRGLLADEAESKIVKKERHTNLGGFKIIAPKREKGVDINTKLDEIRQNAAIEVGTHVYQVAGSDKLLVPTGSIYVTFAAKVSPEKQEQIIGEFNLALKTRQSDSTIIAIVTPNSPNPIKCAMALQAREEVKWAEPDMDMELDSYAVTTPSAKYWGQMWHLQNTGRIPDNAQISIKQGADAKVFEAWKALDGYGNPNLVVAVIDNGFDLSHPDLTGKIVKPWDLWNGSSNVMQGDPTYTHGTPCAGVALAKETGGSVGAAPAARFMPISGTTYSIEGTEAMFNYCINNGADVISCSWGTVDHNFQLSAAKMAAIARAARDGRKGKGCVICYAAGNEGVNYVNFYAAHPDVICVAASTSEDEHADYSNTGREVTICAPSNGGFYPIFAARASWDQGENGFSGASRYYYGDGIDRGPRYKHFGGTSSATPLVAGICALILSANPNLTAREVKSILIQTADKIGSPSSYVNGHSIRYGYGRVNALKAVQEALRRAGKPTTPPSSTTTKPTTTPSSPSANGAPIGTGLFEFGKNTKVVNKGFAVQAGSFSQWANVTPIAQGFVTKYKQPVLIHVTGSGSATMYRILVGKFNTLAEANKLLGTMKANGVAGFAKDLATLA